MTDQEALEKYREMAETHGVCRASNNMLDAWNGLRDDYALHDDECDALELSYHRDAVRQWLNAHHVTIHNNWSINFNTNAARLNGYHVTRAVRIGFDSLTASGLEHTYPGDAVIFDNYDAAQIAAVEALLKEAKP